ncbi:MAG: hypothetical protein MJE77_21185 [Proteobacteria bacterium]|nr:hypothetical protein [Pseudomonadota bacterium]
MSKSCHHPAGDLAVSRPSLLAGLFCLLAVCGACSDSDACVEVTADCVPLYQPTFENVFTNTLVAKCGVAGSACHAREGARAGLIFADIDQAHDLLTGSGGAAARVDSESLGCGVLLARVAADDPARVMPPGNKLMDSEICAIATWIEMGARR